MEGDFLKYTKMRGGTFCKEMVLKCFESLQNG
jgi:hypothetical protein